MDLNADENYVADSLFCKRLIPVWFDKELAKEGEPYRVLFCRIRRKYQKEFMEALEEIKTVMDLFGYLDYEAYCEKMTKELIAG